MEWLTNLMNFGNSAPQTTGYSTLAPAAYQQQVAAQPGFNPIGSGGGGVPTTMNGPTFMQNMLGYTDPSTGVQQQGWGGLALGAASALGNSYMGMKQYGLAKDALKENKRQYNQNYAAQRQTVNTQLEDRQRARVASNAGAYQSVGAYMDQNRIN